MQNERAYPLVAICAALCGQPNTDRLAMVSTNEETLMDATDVMIYAFCLLMVLTILGCIWHDVKQRTANLGEMRTEYMCNCENCECREGEHT